MGIPRSSRRLGVSMRVPPSYGRPREYARRSGIVTGSYRRGGGRRSPCFSTPVPRTRTSPLVEARALARILRERCVLGQVRAESRHLRVRRRVASPESAPPLAEVRCPRRRRRVSRKNVYYLTLRNLSFCPALELDDDRAVHRRLVFDESCRSTGKCGPLLNEGERPTVGAVCGEASDCILASCAAKLCFRAYKRSSDVSTWRARSCPTSLENTKESRRPLRLRARERRRVYLTDVVCFVELVADARHEVAVAPGERRLHDVAHPEQ